MTLPARPDRMVVVGVLNVTPDSFSDGGRYTSIDDAVAHAAQMVQEGADLIDVGGESTRPGARRIDAEEEQRRVLPVIRELAGTGVRRQTATTCSPTPARWLIWSALACRLAAVASPTLPKPTIPIFMFFWVMLFCS